MQEGLSNQGRIQVPWKEVCRAQSVTGAAHAFDKQPYEWLRDIRRQSDARWIEMLFDQPVQVAVRHVFRGHMEPSIPGPARWPNFRSIVGSQTVGLVGPPDFLRNTGA